MIPCSLGNWESEEGGDEKLGLNAIHGERCRNRFLPKDSIPMQGLQSLPPPFIQLFFPLSLSLSWYLEGGREDDSSSYILALPLPSLRGT